MSLLVSKTIRGSRYRLKYLVLDLKKSTKIRVRGQIHVKKRKEPKFIYHLLITEHWKSVSGFLFKKENKCSMFLPPN